MCSSGGDRLRPRAAHGVRARHLSGSRLAAAAVTVAMAMAMAMATLLAAPVAAAAATAKASVAAAAVPATSFLAQDDSAETSVTVARAQVVPDAFQLGYSARNNRLWLTARSRLLALDPSTLAVSATFTPAPIDGMAGDVFGIAVDDASNTVWTTNSEAGAVSVFDQATGERVAVFSGLSHPREIAIDPATSLAVVTETSGSAVAVFDTAARTHLRTISLGEGVSPMGLALLSGDPGAVLAVIADGAGGQVNLLSISRAGTEVSASLLAVPTLARGPTGIAIDPNRREAFIASMGSGDVTVLSLDRHQVLATIPTGGGAKSVSFDAATRLLYVANRDPGTFSIIHSPTRQLLATVPGAPLANHVLAAAGVAFGVDKSGSVATGGTSSNSSTPDSLHRMTVPAALSPTPSVAAVAEPVAAGSPIALQGSGFDAGTAVGIYLDGDAAQPLSVTNTASLTVAENGTFAAVAVVPPTASEGVHSLTVAVGNGIAAATKLAVLPAAAVAPPAVPGPAALAPAAPAVPLPAVPVVPTSPTAPNLGLDGRPIDALAPELLPIAPVPDVGSIAISATVPESAAALTLSIPGVATAVLGGGSNSGDRFVFTGEIPAVTVTDTRGQMIGGGWAVTGHAADFIGPSPLSSRYLGWTPKVVFARAGTLPGPVVGSGLEAGPGLSSTSTLASATYLSRGGSSVIGAGLTLAVPVGTAAGTYGTTLTLSLFPVD